MLAATEISAASIVINYWSNPVYVGASRVAEPQALLTLLA